MQQVVALAWTGHASMGAASSIKCNRADVATQAADDRHEAELRLSARRAARNMDSRTPVHLLASRFSSDLLISGARIARENTPVFHWRLRTRRSMLRPARYSPAGMRATKASSSHSSSKNQSRFSDFCRYVAAAVDTTCASERCVHIYSQKVWPLNLKHFPDDLGVLTFPLPRSDFGGAD